MQEIYVENIRKVVQNKKKIEQVLNIKLTNKGKNVFVDGKAEEEYIAIEVLEAINVGFSVTRALLLKEENIILQRINIKDITHKKNLHDIRARIIGKDGRTLKTLKNLTDCALSIQDNQIGIIGNADEIEDAIQALTSLIHGSKQGHVYGRVEREKRKRRFMDKRPFENEQFENE